MADIIVAGNTSGSITISAPAVSGTSVLTLPVATDTLVGKATTDTLTNKTLTSPTISSLSSASATALTLQSAGTTAITVDTSQNVGIGAASASGTTLTVKGTTATNTGIVSFFKYLGTAASPTESIDWPTPVLSLRGYGDFTKESMLSFGYSNDANYQTGDGVWNFRLDGIASATSSSSSTNLNLLGPGALVLGNVLMGQTTNPSTGTLVLKVPTGTGNGINAQITSNTGTSYPFANYNASSAYVGGITCTSSATAFPTSSDKRLKKNIKNAPSAINKILTAQVVSHDWLNDVAHVEYGFVAQDLQDTIPQAVVEGTDKEDGSIDMPWGVDYSKIVPLLVKSIQELKAIIDTQAERIKALEDKP